MITGETIKAIRKAEHMTQAEFARIIGYSRPMVCFVERGRMPISGRMTLILVSCFPRYFRASEEQPEKQAESSPAMIQFAISILTGSGWLAEHDKQVITAALMPVTQPEPKTPDGWHDIQTPPEKAGIYKTRGRTGTGSYYYNGRSIYYADGSWYSLNGHPIVTPDYWKECTG